LNILLCLRVTVNGQISLLEWSGCVVVWTVNICVTFMCICVYYINLLLLTSHRNQLDITAETLSLRHFRSVTSILDLVGLVMVPGWTNANHWWASRLLWLYRPRAIADQPTGFRSRFQLATDGLAANYVARNSIPWLILRLHPLTLKLQPMTWRYRNIIIISLLLLLLLLLFKISPSVV